EPMTIALNLRDTLVPHFLRAFDHSFIAQRSPWGWLRDWFFLCYQANLLLAFGSVAWLVIVRELWRRSGESPRPSHLFWSAFVGGVVFLGVAANGARNPWGLAHICLQPLVLLGLAFLASRVERLGRVWQLVLLAGGTVDFCLGIVLQFAVESFALDRWLAADQPILAIFHSYTLSAFTNLAGKIHNHLGFFADDFTPPPALIVAILASILIVTLARTRPDQPCLHLPQPAPSL
ncbi:MAG TPA: hypothetical protein VG710_04270, partial [Opitutus sp.]|nr:hypothetical protein [Opitutus sp.]